MNVQLIHFSYASKVNDFYNDSARLDRTKQGWGSRKRHKIRSPNSLKKKIYNNTTTASMITQTDGEVFSESIKIRYLYQSEITNMLSQYGKKCLASKKPEADVKHKTLPMKYQQEEQKDNDN